MNIGYVKLDKLNKFEYIYKNLFKIIRKKDNCYYIPSNNEKILVKLIEKLKKDNIDYIVQENGIQINEYQKLDGKGMVKYMLPEIINYCFKNLGRDEKLEEIHICVNQFSKENINIIEEICSRVKILNIVTNNIRQYKELEKRLERNDIYITVANNKRKTLKRAYLIINLDFKDFKGYSVNRNSIIINAIEDVSLGKDFEGICIERIKVNTNKIMRIFSEMENMEKSELIEAEIIKLQDYKEIRQLVRLDKLKIMKLLGKRNEILLEEFNSIRKNNIEVNKIGKRSAI